jgi:hypothetical protein
MLACNVSLLHRRASIAVDVAEVAAAVDALGTGNVVFGTLVDDPANVRDRVDAYLGEIMLEAATATSVVNAGLAYAAAIIEVATAADVSSAFVPGVLTAAVVEAATAASAQDATLAAPSRSAMVPDAFINPSASRAANAAGTMVNL